MFRRYFGFALVLDAWRIAFLMLLLVVFVVVWLGKREKQQPILERKETDQQGDDQEESVLESVEAGQQPPSRPHLLGCFIPFSGELLHGDRASNFENDTCKGSTVTIHRATWDPALNKSGKYPCGYVFEGRRINWEVRVQLRFKEVPEGPLRMGIELDSYVPLSGTKKLTMQGVLTALKYIVGEDLHHSVGDDPSQTIGEAERPIFSMPMWAFDQFLETPEGQEPPSLTDPEFLHMGIKRADNASDFKKTLNSTKFRPGPTYSFSFWSISTFIDVILWQISNAIPGVAINFNKFCGRPPVHIAIYTLRPPPTDNEFDRRLLDSRKCYHFHLAFWSSLCPPPSWRVQQLTDGKDLSAVKCKSVAEAPEQPMDFSWGCCYRNASVFSS